MDARRGRGHEGVGPTGAVNRGAQVVDVGLRVREPAVGDLAHAGRHAERQPRHHRHHVLREVDQVRVRKLEPHVLAPEALEALLHVGRVADLAHLAVVHDGDAGRDLPCHDRIDRITYLRAEVRRIIGEFAVVDRAQQLAQGPAGRGRLPVCVVRIRSVRAHQAARVAPSSARTTSSAGSTVRFGTPGSSASSSEQQSAARYAHCSMVGDADRGERWRELVREVHVVEADDRHVLGTAPARASASAS